MSDSIVVAVDPDSDTGRLLFNAGLVDQHVGPESQIFVGPFRSWEAADDWMKSNGCSGIAFAVYPPPNIGVTKGLQPQ